eukprot:scaffold5610_cov71-Phaeocystis_antarctica.AAC.1
MHDLAGGAPEGVLVLRKGRLGQRVRIALRAVPAAKTACSLSTASSLGDTNGVCRRAHALQKVVCQLISLELREAPHLILLGRQELYAGCALHRQQHLAFAKPKLLGISKRRAHLGVLVVIDYECTRSHDARPLRRAVSGAGKEQQAYGRMHLDPLHP